MKYNILLLTIIGIALMSGLVSAITWDNFAYWNFNENTGTNAANQVNTSLNLTLRPQATWNASGVIGSQIKVSGDATEDSKANLTNLYSHSGNQVSISVWVRPSRDSFSVGNYIVVKNNDSSTNNIIYGLRLLSLDAPDNDNLNNTIFFESMGNTFNGVGILSGPILKPNSLYNVVITMNTTTALLYINGTLVNSSTGTYAITNTNSGLSVGNSESNPAFGLYNGTVDELGLWNRTLSANEVSDLYNNGAGTAFGTNPSIITVTIGPPANPTQLVTVGTNFTANYTMASINITNATYFVWNANGSIFNSTLVQVTGNTTNSTILFIDNFVFGDNYIWNVLACGVNNTASICSFAPTNFTFQSVPFTAGSVYWVNNTYETSYDKFNISIVSSTTLSATAVLHYNGTRYMSTSSCGGGTCLFTNNLDIPKISTINNQQNNTFFWNISIYSGTTVTNYISSTYTQTVNRLTLTYCPSGSVALNFTAYDEQNRTRIDPYSFDANFEYYLGTGAVKKNVSISNSTTSEVLLCVNINNTYYTNAIIAYSAPNSSTTYSTRNYFYQNYPIRNDSKKVPLYLLKSSSSTSFILQVQDRNVLPVGGVLVNAQRCYPGINTNETVFISRTDSNGLTSGNFEAETALYKFFITNNSENLLIVDECSKVVPQTTPYTLLFQLGASYQSPFLDISNTSDVNSTLVFNKTSGIVSWTYIDNSGNFSLANLTIRNINWSGNQAPTYCSNTSTLSSGILTCTVTGAGTYFADAIITRTDSQLIDQIVFTVQTLSSTFGYYGVFLGFFIILICAFAFKFNEIAAIALINGAVIFCNAVGLIAFGPVFITAMICVSIIIVAVIER